ncbi:MAG TPA: CGNR zinc finger domain-containing protein [Gaiellaceae bacterium]
MPRYDLPNKAPEPLRLVQRLVNTVDFERDRDWLADLLAEEGVRATPAELERAREAREAIRELLYANNRQPLAGDPHAVLRRAADRAGLELDLEAPALVPAATGVDGLIGQVLAVVYLAMVDGSWGRLKACRNHGCRWAFYDYSRNRSASWCSMQLCGNRTKTRAYRRRHGTAA